MLYTNQSIRFTESEIAGYRAQGVDVSQITTYRQFLQIVNRQRRHRRKEKEKMAKRFRRKALNGSMEYYDSYDELLAAQRKDVARLHTGLFAIIGLIAGGMLVYSFMQWMHVDSRVVRFMAVVAGVWFGAILGASLSALLWPILKWALILTIIIVIGSFVFLVV